MAQVSVLTDHYANTTAMVSVHTDQYVGTDRYGEYIHSAQVSVLTHFICGCLASSKRAYMVIAIPI